MRWLYLVVLLLTIETIQSSANQKVNVTHSQLTRAQKAIDSIEFTRGGLRDVIKIYDGKKLDQYCLRKVLINADENDFETCVITYASINKALGVDYQASNKRQIEALKNNGFKGHYLYRHGGWPNMEKGCLAHSHIPYFFKVCALKEAMDLGYKTIIWLDSWIEPQNDVSDFVAFIKEYGMTYDQDPFMFKHIFREDLADDFSLSKKDVYNIIHINLRIFGVDTTKPQIRDFIEEFHDTSRYVKSYFNFAPEQAVFSILAWKHHLDRLAYPNLFAMSGFNSRKETTLFVNEARKYIFLNSPMFDSYSTGLTMIDEFNKHHVDPDMALKAVKKLRSQSNLLWEEVSTH